jgi:NitT/TauT family transport system substrate-binding protein
MRLWFIRHTVCAITGGLCLLGAVAVAPAAQAAETITLGVIRGIPTINWPLYIAKDEGMFKAEGLDVQPIGVGFAYEITQQVIGGSLNMGSVGLIEPVVAASKGAHVAIVREEGALPPFILIAKPSIKSISDLKGKTVSLGGVNDSTVAYFKRMLAPAHLNIDQVDKVYAGSTADRYSQLRSGAVDAALLLPPFDYLAEAAGYNHLGDAKDYVTNLPFTGYIVSDAWGKAHAETIKKFLAAYQKAVDWFYDRTNRDQAVKIAVSLSKGNPEDVEKTYEALYRLQFFAKTGAIPKQHLENLIELGKELGLLKAQMQPDGLVLPSVTDYQTK